MVIGFELAVVTNVRVCTDHFFSIQLEDETQHAVGSRMLGTLDDKSGGNSIGYGRGS
jgi:hypothetical protein